MSTELITRKQAAEILGVSLSTFNRYVLAGMIRRVKLGDNQQSAARYFKADVEKLINASIKPGATRAKRVPAQETYRPKSW